MSLKSARLHTKYLDGLEMCSKSLLIKIHWGPVNNNVSDVRKQEKLTIILENIVWNIRRDLQTAPK